MVRTPHNQFLAPRCTLAMLDRYVVRQGILTALHAVLPQLSGTLLDVGSGQQPYKPLLLSPPSQVHTYLALDLRNHLAYQKPDLEWDGTHIPLHENSVESALATEVFEHCPHPEVVMREICRTLKPGGILFFTVPFLWPLHDVPYDEYRYTPFALERHLRNAGFANIELKATGGWDRSMAQMIGLWARRRWPRGGSISARLQRRVVKPLVERMVQPLVCTLPKIDTVPHDFCANLMMPGLSGIAFKPGAYA